VRQFYHTLFLEKIKKNLRKNLGRFKVFERIGIYNRGVLEKIKKSINKTRSEIC